jgi:hypothetical protein
MYELLNTSIKKTVDPGLPSGLPGPQALLTGNSQVGFFGEVTGTDFATYAELTTLAGVTTGNAMNPSGLWLKLAYKGNVQYMSKLSVRNNVSWSALNALGLITGKQVTIKGKVYKVRLMQGANIDPWSGTDNAAGGSETLGTEWNKLIYGLTPASVGADIEGPALANYTTTDLGLSPFGAGTSILVKELAPGNISSVRGNASGAIKGLYKYGATTSSDTIRGWKPIVEYVSG